MKKLMTVLLSGVLFAEDLMFMEEELLPSIEIENVIEEPEVPVVPEVVEEPLQQVVCYLTRNQLVLDRGLVLAPNEPEYLELFDVDDDVSVLKISDGYLLVHNLTQVEVICTEIGRVFGKDLVITKTFNEMIELSNGNLYLTGDVEESFWAVTTSVLYVQTDRGDMLIDLSSGVSEYVVCLGSLDTLRTLDFVVGVKGHHLNLELTGPYRSITEDLGSLSDWNVGDEVIVQKFNNVNIATFDPLTPFILVHNVTRNEVAIVVLLTH